MLLSVRGLKSYFYMENEVIKAVNGVDFDIEEGEILGIVGESGSEKCMRLGPYFAYYLFRPCKISGEIYFKGTDLLKLVRGKCKR